MKTLIAITYILLLTSLTSCDNNTTKSLASSSDTLTDRKVTFVDSVKAVNGPEDIPFKFLIWYKANKDKLRAFEMVNNAGEESFDSTKFYAVNFQETEKYLSAVEKSGFVSSIFIENWRKYFVMAEKQFKLSPQNDGPPENFEYDLLLQSQDADEDLEVIEKSKMLSKTVQNERAVIILVLPFGQQLKFTLSRVSENWLIDSMESVTER